MEIRSLFISAESKVPDSWGHGDDCCSWEGITCDNGTRQISRLKLSAVYQPIPIVVDFGCWNMNLAIFSSFRELQLLDFSWNAARLQNFEGLQGLSKLKYLDLAENCLVESIPGSFGKLTSLEVINISGNNMNGALQDAGFRNLRNLRELHLRSSNLSGSLPASVFALPSLEYLDLSDNLFEGHIPINSTWRLSNNNLRGKIFGGASNLSNLLAVYLDNNKFEGTFPKNLSGKVEVMDLHDNEMTGELDTSLWNLPLLEALSLASNGLTAICYLSDF
uniref:Uncharacterized protein n=1 Tax=Avena sativa TaxID=4498 RepID=A0ACD5Y4V0_AVESA